MMDSRFRNQIFSYPFRWYLAGFICSGVLYSLLVSYFPPSQNAVVLISQFFVLIPSALVVLVYLWASQNGKYAGARRTFLMQSVGFAFWLLGDAIRLFSARSLFTSPTMISLMHWSSLAGWVLIMASWLWIPIQQQRYGLRLKLMLDIAISTGALVALCWLAFIQPVSSQFTAESATNRWMLVYPVLDLIILSLVLNLYLLNPDPSQRRYMVWYLAGMLMLTISDLSIRMLSIQQAYLPGSALDIGLLFGNGFIFLGAVQYYPIAIHAHLNAQEPPQKTIGQRLQTTLPFALAIVLIGELAVLWQMNRDLPATIIGFAAMVWLLLIARQGVAAGEFELQQYALLFKSSTEPAFICDQHMQPILMNPAMINLCAIPQEGDLEQRSLEKILGITIPKISSNTIWQTEVTIARPDGRTIPIEISIQAIQVGLFKRKLYVGAIHDLTIQKEQQFELQKMVEHVRQMHDELEELNNDLENRVVEKTSSLTEAYSQLEKQHLELQSLDQLKSDFISLVSHELRAPLTNISGGIQLLLAEQSNAEQNQQVSLSLVQREIQRLTRFVESILDLSALEAGKMPLYCEPLDLGAIIHQLQMQFSQYPGSARLEWNFPALIPPVIADSQALNSIIFHLVDNGLKYATDSTIHIFVAEEGTEVKISVSDDGDGIDAEALPYIFDKFYRANSSDSQMIYGRGIGLYMAKRLVNAMNGRIVANNLPKGGVEFVFWLPIMETEHES